MGNEENGIPTIGGKGVTVDVIDSDGGGSVSFDEPEDTDTLLEIAGVKTKEEMTRPLGELGGEVEESELESGDEASSVEMSYEERVREALPEKALLTDNGVLMAENNRSDEERQGSRDCLNGKRRYILNRLDEGDAPLEIEEDTGFSDSYIYRARGVFSFILDDDLLREAFLDDGGEYAPAYTPEEVNGGSEEFIEDEEEAEEFAEAAADHDEEEEEEEESDEFTGSDAEVNTKDLADIIDHYFEKGKEEGRKEALEEMDDEGGEDLFDADEWWEIMKVLMENGEDEYARRITSVIDFD